eukprot:Skav202306  [mRNA]  locus=scaffold60:94861:101327:+ [translate_table: standard]
MATLIAKLREFNEATDFGQVCDVLQPHLSRLMSSPRTVTALLKGMSCPEVALKVMDALQADGLEVNLFHCSAVLGVCEKKGRWEVATGILSQMRAERQAADVFCYMPALRACQKVRAWTQALHLFQSMPAYEAAPDAICYNTMIGSAKGQGNWPLAVALLSQMLDASVVPSSIITGTVMSACQEANEWSSVLQLLAQMPSWKLQPDLICFNIAISCESPGAWRISLQCLEEIFSRSLQVSDISFNSAITACGKAAQWQAAVNLLYQMPSAALMPDVISYNAAVAACTQQWAMALQIFTQMALPEVFRGGRVSSRLPHQDASRPVVRIFSAFSKALPLVSPDIITYNAVVSACEKGGQWALALSIFNQMLESKSESLKPNPMTYQGLLSACERESENSALAMLDAFRLPWSLDGPQPLAPEHPHVLSTRQGIVVTSKASGISTEDFVAQLTSELQVASLSIVSRLDYPTRRERQHLEDVARIAEVKQLLERLAV